jgi:hypothetical protein
MTVGELRAFLDSLEGVSDDTVVRVKASFGGYLRSMTIEEKVRGTASAEEVMFGRSVSE